MSPALLFAALLAYVCLDAWAQGGITLRNRRYVPPTEQPAVNTDLHWLLPACYAITCAVAAAGFGWCWFAVGVLLRTAVFDPVLNRRKGDNLFALGSSSEVDRLLRRLGGRHAERLSAAVRVVALAAAILWITFFQSVG